MLRYSQEFFPGTKYIAAENRSFGMSAIGAQFVINALHKYPNNSIVFGFDGEGFSNSVETFTNKVTIKSESGYTDLRDFDIKCPRETKKKMKNCTLVIDWPDCEGEDMKQIIRFKPDNIIAVLDKYGFAGSNQLLNYLRTNCICDLTIEAVKNPKYEQFACCKRRCVHVDGFECEVFCICLRKASLDCDRDVSITNPPIFVF